MATASRVGFRSVRRLTRQSGRAVRGDGADSPGALLEMAGGEDGPRTKGAWEPGPCRSYRGAMTENGRLPRAVGVNHVALEVDDVEAAVAFYSRLFHLRGVARAYGGAFLDLGDQFIALFPPGAGEDRHFGLVVDDKEHTRRVLAERGVEVLPGRFLDFHDPSGNRVQIVQYDQIQFLKAPGVLAGLGVPELGKSEKAQAELRSNGLA